MPLFSIVTVNLNNRSGLISTIDSVENQTFRDFEFIVVDGGSDDGSINIIKSSSVINKYIIEKDNGIYDALNKGINISTGQYVLALNSGDRLANNETLGKVNYSICEDNYSEDIYFGFAKYTLDGMFQDWKVPFFENMDISKWLNNYSPVHQTAFVSRSIYNKMCYDPFFKLSGDVLFWTRVKDFSSFKFINLDICEFELEGIGSSSKSLKVNLRQAFENSVIRIIYDKQNSAIRIIVTNFIKAIIKVLIRKLMGKELYYYLIRYNQKRRSRKYLI